MASSTFEIGDWYLGVRSTSERADQLVRRLLAAHHVGDLEAPPNCSVALADTFRRGAVQDLHLLYRSSSLVVRSRSPSRVLRGLAAHLSAFVPSDPVARSLLSTSMVAGVIDGRAMLLPPHLLGWLKIIQPRLYRLGIQLVDQPVSRIDPETAELVVPAPAVTIDEAVLEEVDAGVRLRSELPPVLPGRYPLAAWLFPAGGEDPGPTSRARAVARVFASVMPGDLDVLPLLERLGGLFTQTAPYAVSFGSADDIVDELKPVTARLAGRRSG